MCISLQIKRHPSLPQAVLTQGQQLGAEPISTENPQMLPAILEQAKQLVRKVIYAEAATPFDVGWRAPQATRGFEKQPNTPSYLLVSQEALKEVAKLVDVTAVCR